MRRFGIQFLILAVMLVCLGALGPASRAAAEEATPAAEALCPSPLATPDRLTLRLT